MSIQSPGGGILRDAVRYWESRRILYNLVLLALVAAWVVLTWPHFRPAMTIEALGQLLIFVVLWNIPYFGVYLVDLPLQETGARNAYRRWRWTLWLIGTLFAVLFLTYWIADEIYPYVL